MKLPLYPSTTVVVVVEKGEKDSKHVRTQKRKKISLLCFYIEPVPWINSTINLPYFLPSFPSTRSSLASLLLLGCFSKSRGERGACGSPKKNNGKRDEGTWQNHSDEGKEEEAFVPFSMHVHISSRNWHFAFGSWAMMIIIIPYNEPTTNNCEN